MRMDKSVWWMIWYHIYYRCVCSYVRINTSRKMSRAISTVSSYSHNSVLFILKSFKLKWPRQRICYKISVAGKKIGIDVFNYYYTFTSIARIQCTYKIIQVKSFLIDLTLNTTLRIMYINILRFIVLCDFFITEKYLL